MTDEQHEEYMANEDNYSLVGWREFDNPERHWAIPMVTGHKYYLRWDIGLDFDKINFDRTHWLWNTDEPYLHFVLPFYDLKEAIYVDDNTGYRHPNNTIGGGE